MFDQCVFSDEDTLRRNAFMSQIKDGNMTFNKQPAEPERVRSSILDQTCRDKLLQLSRSTKPVEPLHSLPRDTEGVDVGERFNSANETQKLNYSRVSAAFRPI